MGVVDLVESIWNNESPDWKRYGSRYAKKLEIYNYEHESTIGNEEIYNYEGKYPNNDNVITFSRFRPDPVLIVYQA